MTSFLVPNTPRKRKSIDEIIAEAEDLPKIDGKNNPSKGTVPLKDDNNSDKKIKVSSVFDIVEVDDYFTISGISYRNEWRTYDLSKILLPNKSQDAHAEDALNAEPDDFIASNASLVYSICKTLYQNKDKEKKDLVENARKTFKSFFISYFLTLSSAVYEPDGFGKVIHDYKQKTSYESKKVRLVGPDGYITDLDTQAKSFVHAVFKTTNSMQNVNNVFEWIGCRKIKFFRINIKPSETKMWPVGFGGGSINNYFEAVNLFNYDGCALGVRCTQNFSGVSK